MEIDNDLLAEMIYESAMYKLYNIGERLEEQRTLQMVRDMWDTTEMEEKKIQQPKLSKRFT